MATAYVALGSNLGNRLETFSRAVAALARLGTVDAASPVYETDPVGYADQPRYLNAVVRLQTSLPPVPLVEHLLAIEREFGRERPFPNAPRPLDLDLLFYDDLVSNHPRATVPHPRLHQRRFVLAPLADLAPDLRHPGLDQTVAELLSRQDVVGGVRVFAAAIPAPGPGVPGKGRAP